MKFKTRKVKHKKSFNGILENRNFKFYKNKFLFYIKRLFKQFKFNEHNKKIKINNLKIQKKCLCRGKKKKS